MTHTYIAAAQQPQYETKDSGQRDEFSSGMLREPDTGQLWFDLLVSETVPFDEQLLTRCAALMERGAQKYSSRIWEKRGSASRRPRSRSKNREPTRPVLDSPSYRRYSMPDRVLEEKG